jgi:hypothetical protein
LCSLRSNPEKLVLALTRRPTGCLYNQEQDKAGSRCPGCYRDGSQSLYAQLSQPAAMQEADSHAIDIAPDANCKGSEDTIDHVYRYGTYRVIDLQSLVDELHGCTTRVRRSDLSLWLHRG